MRTVAVGVFGAALAYSWAWFGGEFTLNEGATEAWEFSEVPGSPAQAGVQKTGLNPPGGAVAENLGVVRRRVPGKRKGITLPPEVQAAVRETAGIQEIAANPQELAKRVQGLEANPARLRELKKFAERFIELPTGVGVDVKR